MAHFQHDGHMAMSNPKGRVNYEPNSWGAAQGGPREDPVRGFTSFAETADGPKQRVRSESFADHYSQARQFLISQAAIEQKRSEEHTSELQSLMRISYAVFCLKKTRTNTQHIYNK